jgi:hypothetical protein
MVDACVIRRAGPATTSPSTGVVTPAWTDVYAGPCKVGAGAHAAVAGAPEAGEHAFVVQRYLLHLPVTATAPNEGDLATVTAAALDASLIGRTYRLAGEFAKTYATARRFQVEETIS